MKNSLPQLIQGTVGEWTKISIVISQRVLHRYIWLLENTEPASYYKDKGLYQDYRGIHAGWIREIKRPILNLITGSKDYDIEKEDAEEWVENNKDILDG